jgi:hypothetical protein
MDDRTGGQDGPAGTQDAIVAGTNKSNLKRF